MDMRITDVAKEMAELYQLADDFEGAHHRHKEEWEYEGRYQDACDEALDRLDHLKHALTFLRPESLDEILVLALMAANHLKHAQPARKARHLRNDPQGDQYINANKLVPVLRLVDAIIDGVEKTGKNTREDIGLAFLRERWNDRSDLVEQASDELLKEAEASQQEEKEAA